LYLFYDAHQAPINNVNHFTKPKRISLKPRKRTYSTKAISSFMAKCYTKIMEKTFRKIEIGKAG